MKKITSICLTIFLGVNIVSAYAARGEQLAILSEDFSAFTEGTESTPAESELSTGNAMIPMEFTHGIQWKGRGIHQAGGVCAVLSYDDYTYGETQGWIQTPYTDVRLDDGNFILRFRARSIAQTKDSLILYLQDQYSSNYYTSEKRTITDQWQTIEVPFRHNFGMGSRLAYVQIGAYNDSWLIDDIEIIQDVYDICSPHAISPKDVTFEHFTARWDAVWSATSYLTSAYYYADEEKTQRVYIAENIETTECECQVTGMEKGKTYFFTVKAKNEKYTSVESNEVQVYIPIRTMPVPELADPTDISDTGYTARWYPVERAMGYAVRHFLKHTARSDEEYTLVHEDLETITEGTFEWPGYFYDYDLNKYSKVPGWGVNMGCTVKGMIGIDNYYRDFEEGKITSPEFDLSRNDGKYTVQLNVYAIHAGDTVYVDSYCEGEKEHREYLMKTVGEHSFSVEVGWLGSIPLAAHQIMISVSTIGFMVYYGMGAALAVRVSHFMGQKDFPNLRRAVNSGMGIILSLAIVASLFFYLARTPIIYSFTEDHEVMIVVSSLIFSLIVYQFGDALQITFANALRGTTDVKPMMWIAFFSYFIVALPVGYLCGFTWGGGVVGVWVAFPAGLFTAGFLFWLRFRYRLQQLMKK